MKYVMNLWMLQLRNQNPNIFWMIQFLCPSFQPANRVVDDFPSWRSSAHGEIASTLRSFRAPTALWNVVAHPMRCDGVHPWWIAVGNGMCVCFFLGLLYNYCQGIINYQHDWICDTDMIDHIFIYFPRYVFTTMTFSASTCALSVLCLITHFHLIFRNDHIHASGCEQTNTVSSTDLVLFERIN